MSPKRLDKSETRAKESYPIFPVFVVMDVSLSMRDEIGVVNAAFRRIQDIVKSDATVAEVARISVVSFADDAVTELGLADLQHVSVPNLSVRGERTNFAAVFRHLYAEIEDSISDLGEGIRFYRPVVFYLTDGVHNHEDDWKQPRKALENPEYKYRPEIVAIGFREAKAESIRRIGTNYAFIAKDDIDAAEQVNEIFNLLRKSIRTNSKRAAGAAAGGDAMDFAVDVDEGKFIKLEPMTND